MGVKWPHFSRFTEYLSKSLGHKGKGGLSYIIPVLYHPFATSSIGRQPRRGWPWRCASSDRAHSSPLRMAPSTRQSIHPLKHTSHAELCIRNLRRQVSDTVSFLKTLTQSLPKPNITNIGNTYLHSYTNKNKSKCSIENQNSCIIASYYARQTFYKNFIYLGGKKANPSKP